MLQRLRDGLNTRKWLAWVALFPIAAIFIFWGGSNSFDFGGRNRQEAAKVDGEVIPATEASKEWSQRQAQWSQQYRSEIPPELRPKVQDDILDTLVLQKLIERRFDKENFRVSDARVLAEIQKVPSFKGPDGKFDPEYVRSVMRSRGVTEQEFIKDIREQILLNQLQQGLGNSYFLSRTDSQRLYNLQNEEREVAYAKFPADQFAGSDPVDEAAIKAYYDKNGDRFMTTESVSLDYAELRLETLAATAPAPTDAELHKLYDANRTSYVREEQRRARHILIPIEGNDDAAAKKKAESVLAEARSGKDFAELAKKYSSDTESAKAGGELGFLERKAFVGPFGDALFAMKKGEIAGPVKSQFGYHIIELEEIQPPEVKPFEEVRGELESQLRQQAADDQFGEKQEQITDRIEHGETDLGKLAQEFGLTRGSIPQFLKGGGAQPLGSSPELQQLVFGDAVLNQGKIGGPLNLAEDRFVLVKTTAHHKAEVKPLAEVHDQIVALLKHDRGVAAAKAAAEAARKKLDAGEKLETVAADSKVTAEPARFVGRADPSVPAALRTALFDAPRPEAKPVARTASLDDGSSVLFVATRSRVGDTSANPQLALQQNAQTLQRAASGDIAAYVDEMKRKAKIVKNPAVFE